MESLFLQSIVSIPLLAYGLLLFGVLVEGSHVAFVAFYLLVQGYFSFFPMLSVIVFGMFFGDMLWYYLGAGIDRLFPSLFRRIHRFVDPLDHQLVRHPFATLATTKFIYGVNRLSLLRAGVVELSFKRFLKADFFAVLLWIFLIGLFSYFFAESLALFQQYFRFVEIGLLIGFILFYFLMYAIAKRLEKAIE
ncbi:MAG: hypothetical protein COU08_04400 [Candidatus Harrisonbacteria bacterium CG10_big_fil_rev_8_21_14_0_10_42_17]|uniref:DedA family protein n=1 Tax=Candidatus Harrisonbacteria bacterium CG10_big_fil_rev_8_21_14_0_10_42_17 TaxID=1974584 RepID=A0A2M6WH54_9BACT|nr:MAG: hypothetical protein COU08_04400 [Candidatus Harrisonbacteria bacterium CG10_big_fil_rev_8_21_14_0_10_42_17]